LVLALAAALIATGGVVWAATVIQDEGGIRYFSGGIGKESRDKMEAMSEGFNVKLVFARADGAYVADVGVKIASANGRTLVDAVSEGPWFFADMPRGTYQITVRYEGMVKERTAHIGDYELIRFTW
jgi:hypothetical protein